MADYFRQVEYAASLPTGEDDDGPTVRFALEPELPQPDDDDLDLYEQLKRECGRLPKDDFLALLEQHRGRLSKGEYVFLARRAR